MRQLSHRVAFLAVASALGALVFATPVGADAPPSLTVRATSTGFIATWTKTSAQASSAVIWNTSDRLATVGPRDPRTDVWAHPENGTPLECKWKRNTSSTCTGQQDVGDSATSATISLRGTYFVQVLVTNSSERDGDKYFHWSSVVRVAAGSGGGTTTTTTTTPTTTTPTTTTPTTPTPPGQPNQEELKKITTYGAGRAANTAPLPLDNGKTACAQARRTIAYLNQELVKAVGNWNFSAKAMSVRGVDPVRLGQLDTRITRLEADLKQAVPMPHKPPIFGVTACEALVAARVVQGTATVQHSNGSRKTGTEGGGLGPGDKITVGPNSHVSVDLGGGSEATLAPNAVLAYPPPSPATPNPGAGVGALESVLQTAGEIFYRIKTGAGRGFRVLSCVKSGDPCPVAAVRGTAFTFAKQGRSVRIRVHQGAVTAASGGKTVLVKAGYESVLVTGADASRSTRFKPPADPFWETMAGLWRRSSDGHVSRFEPVPGGYIERPMADASNGTCRYRRAGVPFRYLKRERAGVNEFVVRPTGPLDLDSGGCLSIFYDKPGEYARFARFFIAGNRMTEYSCRACVSSDSDWHRIGP